ncbi:MAG: class I SAM-dependent methyltransferase [Proteobacteria bacterium]|nr:class I SAM-dependent methyltransferase [Pseudomonadota bacterium]
MTQQSRKIDGSAGDADYGRIGTVYRNYRVADPEIAAAVHAALGNARTVLNIGAGTGSYEPVDRTVTPVEPSATMRERRPAHLPVAVDAYAEQLPFADGAFDAAMGTFTVHQWANLSAGLSEVRRVTRGPVVFLTCDPERLSTYWLHEYAPEVIATEASRYPELSALAAGLGGEIAITPVPIPLNCTDGFNDAYYGRPEMLLDPAARLACSSWSFVDLAAVSRFDTELARELENGEWDRKHGHLRRQAYLRGALVLVISKPPIDHITVDAA